MVKNLFFLRSTILISIFLYCATSIASNTLDQEDATDTHNISSLTPHQDKKKTHPILKAIWGKPAMPLTIIPGMYSYHLLFLSTGHSGQGTDNNNPMLGIVYRGFIASTFVNSFDIRSYSFAVQRYWVEKQLGEHLNYDFGYRLGGIYGYQNAPDGFYHDITCKYWPIIPFVQLVSDLTYHHIGAELGYTMDVISGAIYIRF